MDIRKATQTIPGFRYFINQLNIQSGAARNHFFNLNLCLDKDAIDRELDETDRFLLILNDHVKEPLINKLRHSLHQVKDIKLIFSLIEKKQVLHDVELFEIKAFCLLSQDIKNLLNSITYQDIPDLEDVIKLLDPDQLRLPQFYIYDSYNHELAELRKKTKLLKEKPDAEPHLLEQVFEQGIIEEDKIREKLSIALTKHLMDIRKAYQQIINLDIALAKAQIAIDMKLCKPTITTEGQSYYKALFNPEIQSILHEQGKEFQAVDIDLGDYPTLITGANMSGKTVLLKTLALVQTLSRFGFYLPAASASISIVDKVCLCMGDEQDEHKGLSSFAAEMLKLDSVLKLVRQGKKLLVLIDEPARTTNPIEGTALVNALVDILSAYKVKSLITTHYSGIQSPSRRLRVKGFVNKETDKQININDLEKYIDYSLIDDNQDTVPHEALRVAQSIGIDEELITRAKNYLID
ncbi:DNA mismatch repair protein MutS [Bacteroidales bacterium OttesenSCG-928-I14]|nr:DNA mismatch repair protein MutS [Bacteroidales bacterium OttesenSCG-928-I14]